MSNIDIEAGGTYRFARVQNKTIILDSDNHSHAEKRFANQLKVSGSNVPNVALDVYVKTGGFARIYRQNGVGTTPMFKLYNKIQSGHCGMQFDALSSYTIGVYNSGSSAVRDFQISTTSTLRTDPRTSNYVGLVISQAEEIYLPNIDAATGTNYVRYDTATRELTYITSTQKVKKNITTPSSSIYNNVLSLQPRYFETKNPKDDNRQYLSFIAEEAAAVSPTLVTYGADFNYDESGSRGDLASDNLVPVDINERAIIASLVGKIQDLEQRIQQLES